MKHSILMKAISEKQYKFLCMQKKNSNCMIIEFDGNHIDTWNDIYKVINDKFMIYDNIRNLYHLEEILIDFTYKGNEKFKELYIVIRNLDQAMKRKNGILEFLRNIFSFSISRELDNLVFWFFFAVNVLPGMVAERNIIDSLEELPLERCQLYYVQNTPWTELIDPPHNEIVYLEETEYDALRKSIVTNKDRLVLDLTDAHDTETFVDAMSKYVNGRIKNFDDLKVYMYRGLRDTSKQKKIIFFLKDFSSYCRNVDKYYDSIPITICINFIKYCICYWFYENIPISESWKKEFTFYITETW